MKTIPVGRKGHVALVDDADYEALRKHRWSLKTRTGGGHYAVRDDRTGPKRRKISMHRQLLGLGPSETVDHEDGDGLNNQRGNLRPATHGQNMKNRWKKRNSMVSPYKGVRYCGTHWMASISIDKKLKKLGKFTVAEDAARAYDRAAREHFSEFARVNFPQPGENGALHPSLTALPHLPMLIAEQSDRLPWLKGRHRFPRVKSPAELFLWRKSQGWNQAEAAHHFGVVVGTYRRWEKKGPLPYWLTRSFPLTNATD
jgi:hypothetical protein